MGLALFDLATNFAVFPSWRVDGFCPTPVSMTHLCFPDFPTDISQHRKVADGRVQ